MRSDTIVSEVKLYVEMKSFMVCLNDSVELENERDESVIIRKIIILIILLLMLIILD